MAVALEKIKGKIAENGYSQKDIAKHIGCSQLTFSRKITGKREFSAKEISTISEMLKTPIEYFFKPDVIKNVTSEV